MPEERDPHPRRPERSAQSARSARSARFEQALDCFREARDLADPEASPGVYGVILHDIADTYRDAHDIKEAVEHFRQAVSYKERADNPSDLATTMTALANTLASLGEPTEARDVLERLAEEVPKIADTERRAAVLHNMGLTYEELGRLGLDGAYADGVAAYQAVLALIDGDVDPGWYATVLKDIGDAYESQEMLPQAHASYEEAVRYTRRIEDTPASLITVLIALGRTARRLARREGEALGNGAAPQGGAVGTWLGGGSQEAGAGAPGAGAAAPDAPSAGAAGQGASGDEARSGTAPPNDASSSDGPSSGAWAGDGSSSGDGLS
ncbi:tetratricopeptide repeat protein [Streptomyces sp. NPDC003032]